MKSNIYTLTYACVLAVICALALTAIGRFTEPYRKANEKADMIRSVLEVLGAPADPSASSRELVALFDKKVRTEKRGDLKAYLYVPDDGPVRAVAVPFKGPGLWGPIEGFIALKPDMRTIRGIAFTKQEETPGLGGEIAAAWFRRQFIDKQIINAKGEPGIRILHEAGDRGPNEVDGITGATMTCDKVQEMINETINKVVKEWNDDR